MSSSPSTSADAHQGAAMPTLAATDAATRYDAAALRAYAVELLMRIGMRDDIATDVGAVLVNGDLMGHSTHGLALLAPKGIEHGPSVGSQDRRNTLLFGGEHCLECPLHRLSRIEKDAHVPFRFCQGKQAKESAECLFPGT